MKDEDKQRVIDQLAQLEADAVHHQMYGTRYLKKSDGTIVLRYPDGSEGPLPKYEDYGDEL